MIFPLRNNFFLLIGFYSLVPTLKMNTNGP